MYEGRLCLELLLPGWREGSRFRFREGAIEVFDFDLYSQALAKIERGFDLDLDDLRAMIDGGLVEPPRLRRLFDQVRDQLYKFPAIDPSGLELKLDRALR